MSIKPTQETHVAPAEGALRPNSALSPGRPYWPAEWAPHSACWLAWPSHPEEWRGDLRAPRRELAALCAAIAHSGDESGKSGTSAETIEMLVLDQAAEDNARAALAGLPVRYHRMPYGDIWLRDTGPVFIGSGRASEASSGRGAGVCTDDDATEVARAVGFAWNGWGGAYLLPHDEHVAAGIADRVAVPFMRYDWVLEGGAIDGDGEGSALTTRQCLLNPNRNPAPAHQAQYDARLHAALGIERVIWLNRGLINDHTDGHVDTLARFVAPGRVVCMRAARGRDIAGAAADPNRHALDDIVRALGQARDARGRALEVIEIPAPGPVYDTDDTLLPASYVNFYIANQCVIVPTYGVPADQTAVELIGALFPERRTVGLSARAILAGGGAFHCVTREQPSFVPAPASTEARYPTESPSRLQRYPKSDSIEHDDSTEGPDVR